jgi:DNA mismatch repair protein MutS
LLSIRLEQELSDLQDRIHRAVNEAVELEREIFAQLTAQVVSHSQAIRNFAMSLAWLDVSSSLAKLAFENNYCRPLIDESMEFVVRKGRHPIV